MRQTLKAFSKKLFGAHYEQLRRVLPLWLILFFSFYLSGIWLRIAPSVLYVTVFSYSAGITWRLLTSESHTEDMRHLLLLPFDHRSFVFSYVFVLGAYTLLTKTAGLLAILLAVCPRLTSELPGALLCAVFAVVQTTCIFALIRRKNTFMQTFAQPEKNVALSSAHPQPEKSAALLSARPQPEKRIASADAAVGQTSLLRIAHLTVRIMTIFWPAAFLAAVLLQSDLPAVLLKAASARPVPGSAAATLPIIIGGSLHAAILLSNTDAYTFYGGTGTRSRSVRSGRHALAWRYLARYLLSHKNYLLNTVVLWGIAGVLPVFFTQVDSSFAGPTSAFILPIGFAILSLNTPICILLSCDPALEQALRVLPHPARTFLVPYCLFIFLCNLSADIIFLCSYALQGGGIHAPMCLTAAIFALFGAAGSVFLEWFFPLRGWKTENDLWHHPRKYVVPAVLLIFASVIFFCSQK